MDEYTKISAKQFIEDIKAGKKLENCAIDEIHINGETINREIQIENCTIAKLTLQNCIFKKSIAFSGVTFLGEVTLNFDKEEHKDAGQTIYENEISFLKCVFKEELHGKSAIFEQYAAFDESKFEKRASFAKAHFIAKASFAKVHFESTCRFEATRFDKLTSFEESIFSDKANFKKVYFYKTFLFRKVKFEKNVTFENATFTGFARFEDMSCVGKFSLKKVTMDSKGYFHRVVLGEGIFRGLTAKDSQYFSWMECGGDLDFSGIEASASFYIQETKCAGQAIFKRSVFHHDLHLIGSSFGKRVDLGQTVFHMRLNCTECTFNEDVVLYASNPNILLLKREQIEGKIASHREEEFNKAKEVYVMLRRCFDYWGEHENSEWAYYNFRKAERKAHTSPNPINKFKVFCNWLFFDLGCGYGTKPINVTILASFLILIFSSIFWSFGQFFVVDPSLGNTTGGISFMQALYISSMNFVTLGTEGISPSFDHWIKYLVAIEGFLGLFLMTVFVGTYTRKMAK
ncbi:pentapeptide repeat-containing protein [Candidatus Uabimicrobium sp. HlEnr_7]|uniref:pentapeptide repeat-containing protein n=1 Tax=Candidatus Uabimicrobium helgolandensis TaxID=3095367 RepID=UPI0035573BD5